MFSYDKKICPFRLLAMENRFHMPVKIGIEGQEKTVFVGGFIDRIDRTDQGIRVIDYKTGADTTAFKTIASVSIRQILPGIKQLFRPWCIA